MKKIEVKFFKGVDSNLRGFAGINTIYLNAYHFQLNEFKYKNLDKELFHIVSKVDIISLAIHEFSHVRLRMVWNMEWRNAECFVNITIKCFLVDQRCQLKHITYVEK